MKRKTVLAVLLLCAALAASACGTEEEKAVKENTAAEQTETEEKEDAEKKEDTEEDKTEDTGKKEESAGTRLVSVKDVSKYITIGQYKGISLDNTVTAVTEEDVEAQIAQELSDNAQKVTDSTAAVENGDTAEVSYTYTGTKGEDKLEGSSDGSVDIAIGEGLYGEEFEAGIAGMKTGETKALRMTVPEGYINEELSGADVEFQITVESFRRAPELTQEWVAGNTDYKTVDEYRAGIRASMEQYAKAAAESALYSDAWYAVVNASEIKEYPQKDVDNAIGEYQKQIRNYAEQSSMEYEEFIESQGYTMEAFEDECQTYAEQKVMQNLIIQGIMDAEGMSLEDEESSAIQEQIVQLYGGDLAAVIDMYGQTMLDESIALLRVEQFIVDNANIQEKVQAGDETVINGDAGEEEAEADADAEDENAAVDAAAETADIEAASADAVPEDAGEMTTEPAAPEEEDVYMADEPVDDSGATGEEGTLDEELEASDAANDDTVTVDGELEE